MPPRRTDARKLILDIFSHEEELKLFLGDVEAYADVTDYVAWNRGRVVVAQDVVERLDGRGHLTAPFFDRLVEAYPAQEKRIRDTERLICGSASTASAADALGARLVTMSRGLEATPGAQPTEGLQAIIDATNGLTDPLAYLTGIANAMRRTAMIEIGGTARGTGFLVGDRYLLTNAHVVGAVTAPPPDSLEVVAVFDFTFAGEVAHAERGRRVKGRTVRVSLPTPAEAENRISDWNAPTTHLDYALVELSSAVAEACGGPPAFGALSTGTPRGAFTMSRIAYEFDRAPMLLVMQHPLGERQMLSRGRGPFSVNGLRTRLRYDANTLPGSSGSSVLDDRGRLVALHHYGREGANQGVPISAIANDLASAFPMLVSDT